MQNSPRRRTETIVLALVAIASVVPLRCTVESKFWFWSEMATLALCLAASEMIRRSAPADLKFKADRNSAADRHSATDGRWRAAAVSVSILMAISPAIFAVLTRVFGSPIAFELSILATCGSTALSIATSATTSRTRAMSLVMSGFLVLFATSISDAPAAVVWAIAWMTICVWHLIANHWETLDLCPAERVQRTVGIRWASVGLGLAVCGGGAMLAQDRFGPSARFAGGFMPTSGGSSWSDPAARSGIGTGDAAIAAKDHAESFGAVESEIFLESNQSTLFDMFNDMIGEPKTKKNKTERRQGLANQEFIPMHEQASKTEKGGSSFSTDRMPPKQHRPFEDTLADAVVQWDGPTGVRLALERLDTFDGTTWTDSSSHGDPRVQQHQSDSDVWFFDRKLYPLAMRPAADVDVHLLKVLNLSTTHLPAPMMTAGLHIKDVDRADFFGIDDDGSLFMPGREAVPPMTVVNLASLSLMEDELIERIENYPALQSIVTNLRTNFVHDPAAVASTDDPVGEFCQTRRGGDYMFATVAALRAREIGLRSRLVTGFYVRPEAYDFTAGHASVSPRDVHVWTEIDLGDGRWFEIEPTPGYRQPIYTPSMWLRAKRLAMRYWPYGIAAGVIGGLMYRTRLIWIEWLLSMLWCFSWPLVVDVNWASPCGSSKRAPD